MIQDIAYKLYRKDYGNLNKFCLTKQQFLFNSSLYVNIYFYKAKKI